ncbi:nucleoid-associated protein [Clostridioides difficile]
MEYINDINIQDAVIHILDSNAIDPILNEYTLELNEDTYKFLHKHIEKCLKDEELKTAVFNSERNIVKEIVQDYLNAVDTDLLGLSKELARQLFSIMKGNVNIPSCDLVVVSLITDVGPMIGILKMDYVKNFTHAVEFVDDKIGIGIVPQAAGLPASSQRIQKAAFIKPIREEQVFDLYVIDKQKKSNDDEYGANYFMNSFLGCSIVTNKRDMTKTFLKAAETWTRSNITEDAEKAERIRTTVKSKLREEDSINIEEFSNELFKEEPTKRQDFETFMKGNGLEQEVAVDKAWVEKKLKRVRLKIDKDIDLYINEEAYHDNSKFEIQRNGDGSINMIIKHVINYIEK